MSSPSIPFYNLTEIKLWQLALAGAEVNWNIHDLYLLHDLTTPEEISLFTGCTLQVSTQVAAIIELQRRQLNNKNTPKACLNSPLVAYKYLHTMSEMEQEIIRALYLDSQLQIISDKIIAIGSINVAQIQLREVLRPALLANASTFILAHNHPSANNNPSENDLEFTKYITTTATTFGISLQDHLIINAHGFISLRQQYPDCFA